MKRREFLLLSAAATAGLAMPSLAFAAPLDYKPGLLKARQEAGEVILIDFSASWCSTCHAQERAMDALKAENPAYEANITFIKVDWDIYGASNMAAKLKIPRRSTLVTFDGEREIGRIIAQTRKATIKDLMDGALAAATKA